MAVERAGLMKIDVDFTVGLGKAGSCFVRGDPGVSFSALFGNYTVFGGSRRQNCWLVGLVQKLLSTSFRGGR